MHGIGQKVEIVVRTTGKAARDIWRKPALSEADVQETASWLPRWYSGPGYAVERVETRIVDDGVKDITRTAL